MSVHHIDPEEPESTVVPGPWLTPEETEQLATNARAAVQATKAGMADLTTGTIRLEKTDDTAPAGVVEGVVVERLDDDVETDPRWQTWSLLPESLTDPAVRRHRAAGMGEDANLYNRGWQLELLEDREKHVFLAPGDRRGR